MAHITQAVRDFLNTGPLGHVVTLNLDGTPHITLAWVGIDDDELVWSSFVDQHKLESLRRDPRITISFQANGHTGEGLHPYLVAKGTARITEGGALRVMDQLAGAYIGPGAIFPNRDMPDGFTIHVEVERTYGLGPWVNEGD